jgi:hypothetical protein
MPAPAAPAFTARPTSAPAAPAPAVETTEQQAAPAPSDEAASNEVVAVMEPAITGRVPTPRRKPPANASARLGPPLPRPRPDGPAPQSPWTATPVQDDRYPAASQ